MIPARQHERSAMRNLREFLWVLVTIAAVGLLMTAIVRIVLK